MQKQCTREDLRVEVSASCPVLDSGQPDTACLGESWDIATDLPYFCGNCGHEFDTIGEALNHLSEPEGKD